MKKIDLQQGTIFYYDTIKLKVVKNHFYDGCYPCDGCYLLNDLENGACYTPFNCSNIDREDKTNVIFEEVNIEGL